MIALVLDASSSSILCGYPNVEDQVTASPVAVWMVHRWVSDGDSRWVTKSRLNGSLNLEIFYGTLFQTLSKGAVKKLRASS